MSFLEWVWLVVLAVLMGLYMFHFAELSSNEHASLLIALGIAAFMFAYRRKLRRNKSRHLS